MGAGKLACKQGDGGALLAGELFLAGLHVALVHEHKVGRDRQHSDTEGQKRQQRCVPERQVHAEHGPPSHGGNEPLRVLARVHHRLQQHADVALMEQALIPFAVQPRGDACISIVSTLCLSAHDARLEQGR